MAFGGMSNSLSGGIWNNRLGYVYTNDGKRIEFDTEDDEEVESESESYTDNNTVFTNTDVVEEPSIIPKLKRWDLFEVNGDQKQQYANIKFWKKMNIFAKIFICTFISILVFSTAILSKFTFLLIAFNINITPEDVIIGRTKNQSYTLKVSNKVIEVQWIWAMVIIMCTPYVFTIVKCIQQLLFKHPRKLKIPYLIIALLLETLHSIGLGIFVFIIAPFSDGIYTLMVAQGIGIIPALFKCFPNYSSGKNTNGSNIIIFVVSCIVHVAFLVVMAINIYSLNEEHVFLVFAILTPLSLLLISLHWWENFIPKRYQFKDLNGYSLEAIARKIRHTKIDLTVNIWKIILSIAIPFAIFAQEDCAPTLWFRVEKAVGCSLLENITLINDPSVYSTYYLPLLLAGINIVSSIIGFKVAKAACVIRSQRLCFSLPLALATPAMFLLLLMSYTETFIHDIFGTQLTWLRLQDGQSLFSFIDGYTYTLWLPILILEFANLLITTGHVWTPGAVRVASTAILFVKPLYCGIFFDQSLLLNRRTEDKYHNKFETDDRLRKMLQEKGYYDYDSALPFDQQKTSLRKSGIIPLIYACATMWHETEQEMTQLLKSILRMDLDQFNKAFSHTYAVDVHMDMYEFEAHVYFDDAFKHDDRDGYKYRINEYVQRFLRILPDAVSVIHNNQIKLRTPHKILTPYGGRLEWTMPGDNKLIVHLKDKKLIKIKKRWSQVMYMYYLLSFRLMCDGEVKRKTKSAQNTFILALDGDVEFYPGAVQLLVDRMRKDPNLGAAAGRIHPIGSGPMVWYQQFEYSISHWLQKATEHIIGCVLCSPGCFSLFRGSALMRDDVIKKYATVSSEARHYVQFDMGEDRWLCTLLLQAGLKIEYCAAADASTFCPEGFREFYKQRRRWTPSTMANILDILGSWRTLRKTNNNISLLYIIYQVFLFISSILTPGTIFLLILGAFNTAYPDVPLYGALILNLLPVVIFIIMCYTASEENQLGFAAILSTIYSLVMMIVIVGLIKQIVESQFCSVTAIFFLGVVGIFVVSAMCHPKEFLNVLYGLIYFLTIPSSSMLLIFYALGNLHNVSWGTREDLPISSSLITDPKKDKSEVGKGSTEVNTGTLFESIKSKFTSDYVFSFGNLFRCMCCPNMAMREEDVKMKAILDKLQGLEEQIDDLRDAKVGTGDGEFKWNKLPYLAPDQQSQSFSSSGFLFESGHQVKANPLFKERVEVIDDKNWIKDPILGQEKTTKLNNEEEIFWNEFIDKYMKPTQLTVLEKQRATMELNELRNKVCLFFFLGNALFVTIIFILESVSRYSPGLTIQLPCDEGNIGQRIEPISVAFTLIFGILLVLQFICMLFHRFSTLIHIASSTDIRCRQNQAQIEQDRLTALQKYNSDCHSGNRYGSLRSMTSIQSDNDTYFGDTLTKQDGRSLGRILTKRQRVEPHGNTNHRMFDIYRKNLDDFQTKLNQLPSKNITDAEIKHEIKQKFRKVPARSLKAIVNMAKDEEYKKRLRERTTTLRRWYRAVELIPKKSPPVRFLSIVEDALKQKHRDNTEANGVTIALNDVTDDQIVYAPAADTANNQSGERVKFADQITDSHENVQNEIEREEDLIIEKRSSKWSKVNASKVIAEEGTRHGGGRTGSSLWPTVVPIVRSKLDKETPLLTNVDAINEGTDNQSFEMTLEERTEKAGVLLSESNLIKEIQEDKITEL